MSNQSLKVQLLQLNFIVGDLAGNCQKILDAHQKAKSQEIDLILFSELAICGYPPEDLLLKKHFLEEIDKKIEEIKKATIDSKTAILLGCPYLKKSTNLQSNSSELYNSAFLIEGGDIVAIANKTCLPNYGVFDEYRYFKPSPTLTNIEFRGFRFAVLICEDIWSATNAFLLGDKVFDFIISINASPFVTNKLEQRSKVIKDFIKNLHKPVLYVNQIGGQDSLVFDGGSFVSDKDGKIILRMKEFAEDSSIITLSKKSDEEDSFVDIEVINNSKLLIQPTKEEQIYNALILGLRDYVHKSGFKKILLGLSGGIDSALVTTIAIDALGPNNVKLFALPSKFNSQSSMDDAIKIAKNLGIKLEVINIEPIVESINKSLEEQFVNTKINSTEENIQSRARASILMALSNKFGYLLLSTGNKSELAVGYATIYGDMCGAFNPLKDIYKTEVFALAKWRNKNIPAITIYQKLDIIPQNIITKAPTAELRENQKDSDSLPEYKILDKILYQLIEEEKSSDEIVKSGFEKVLVDNISKLLRNSEYKRKQAVIGTKISEKSFDKDRRYSLVNQFKQ
jgi:NAD+ synthase